ncbi:MAG TPA: protein kinase [Acidobacteriaceae bacterium]|jgi:hypothetical protein|nr:protein kinase [Acidobacteriaceae bacterium]
MNVEDSSDSEVVSRFGEEVPSRHSSPSPALKQGDFSETIALDDRAERATDSRGSASASIAPGQTIGNYQVLSLLGRGGMGEVYLALDVTLNRRVALKLLPRDLTGDKHRVRRFTHEARAASALSHPNIVAVYGFGECELGQYLAMELVEGRSPVALAPLPLEPSLVANIGLQIARALQATHARGLVHRDLKPDNMLVRPDGVVKILDFGIARLAGPMTDDMETALTLPGTTAGTPKYMSPEQVRGDWPTTGSDIFSLGTVLYELATARHPFESDSAVGFMHSILSRSPIAPYRLNPSIPAWLDSLLLRMLEKDPERRCTATELAQALAITEETASAPVVQVGAPSRRLVGRRRELAELHGAAQEAAGGQSLMVTVSGEPGLGKTTLIEEFLQELSAGGKALIATGRCSERLAGAGAYLPILEMLGSLLSGVEHESVAAAMKALAPSWYGQLVSSSTAPAAAPALQEALQREFTALLCELSRYRPLVIFLDDMHWADISTTDLLSHIRPQLERMRVLIVVTFRPAEMHSSRHPFLHLQHEMQARRLAREVALGFFSSAEIREYIDGHFPGHGFPEEFAVKIEQRTEGNPLFVADLLRYLQERGAIVAQDYRWSLSGPVAELLTGMPDSVRSMVQRKMEQLDDSERKLLTMASVQGQDFNAAVIAHALDADAADVEEELTRLEQKSAFFRLVDEHELPDRTLSLRYRFVHVLYQDAFYGALRPARRSTASRAVAEALLHFHGARAQKLAAQLAALFEAARDFERAAAYYLMAAQNALLLFASSEAESLARRGIACVQALPDSDGKARAEMGLQQLLGLALRNLKTHSRPEAAAIQQRVLELAEQLNDYPTQFAVHYSIAQFFNIHQDFPQALRQAEHCLRIAQQQKDARMVAAAHLVSGDITTHQGRLLDSRRHLEAVGENYDPADAPFYARFVGTDPGAHAKGILSVVLCCLGYPDQGREALRRSMELAEAAQNPIASGVARICAIVGFKHLGDRAVLRQAADELIEICARNEFQSSMLYFGKFGSGWDLALSGQPAEGLVLLDEAVAQVRQIEMDYALAMLGAGIAEIMRLAGRPDLALQFLDEHLPQWEQCGHLVEIPDLLRHRGECLLELRGVDSVAGAERCFRRSMELAAGMNSRFCELRAATSLGELLLTLDRRQEAYGILAPLYAWFTEGETVPAIESARTLLEKLR